MRDWNALLIHGAGGGAWEWNRWRGVFEAHAIGAQAVELQTGPQGIASTSLHDYARQVREELRQMQRPRVVVGASLGGLLAAISADDADALILVNPLPPAPWNERLPARNWEPVVPWQRNGRLQATRVAMDEADDASALLAFRRWRDESGAALGEAQAGVAIESPDCPALFVVSAQDEEVPPEAVSEWATAWRADKLETIADSHLGPLLGRHAQSIAVQAVAWLNRLGGTC